MIPFEPMALEQYCTFIKGHEIPDVFRAKKTSSSSSPEPVRVTSSTLILAILPFGIELSTSLLLLCSLCISGFLRRFLILFMRI